MKKASKIPMLVSKKGYTLIEALVSVLIISMISTGLIFMMNDYYRITYDRDTQLKHVIDNVNTLEKVKAAVHTIADLYEFTKENPDIRIIAVGVGEVSLQKSADSSIQIVKTGEDEQYAFNHKFTPHAIRIFRLEVGNSVINSKLISIVYLGGGSS